MDSLEINAAGIAGAARWVDSPNQDARPDGNDVSLIVIHNISLPPKEYGGEGILQLFTNRLDPLAHPYYATVHELRVSSHFLIRRDGELLQFVSCCQRAWHAGASTWKGRERCNDFSVGIELEGCDEDAFEQTQYETLDRLLAGLMQRYPIQDIVGHSDIAPGRKTDPGPCFDWSRVTRIKP
jgi:AmpD protein